MADGVEAVGVAAGGVQVDLYASTCSWLEDSVGVAGAGEVLLGIALIALAALAWRVRRTSEHAPDKLGHKVEAAKSMLEEITERERQRRLALEAEVEQLRELKRKKAEDIERFRKIKDEEERKVRERQEMAQQEAQRKKELELAQEQLEKEALRRAHTEGMLCVMKDAKAALPDVTLRVPLVDSVDFPTTISHLKSRIRADYIGQPLEHRQRIVHGGKPQSDAIKLVDIFNQHSPKTEPVPFFVIIGQELPAVVRQQRAAAAPIVSAQEPEEPDPAAEVAVRVKRGKLGPDILLTMRMGDTVDAICREIAGRGVPLSCPSASGGSILAAQLDGDLSRIRLVMYGRILKRHESLTTVLEAELDKSSVSLSVYVAPVAVPAASSAAGAGAEFMLTTEEASEIFDALDTNSDGEISMIEFIKGLRSSPDLALRLKLPSEIQQEAASRTVFQHAFGEMDEDLSKSISRAEFVRYYTRARASAGGDNLAEPPGPSAVDKHGGHQRGAAQASKSDGRDADLRKEVNGEEGAPGERGSLRRDGGEGVGDGGDGCFDKKGAREGTGVEGGGGGGGGGGGALKPCTDNSALNSAQQADKVQRKLGPGGGGGGEAGRAGVLAEVVAKDAGSRASMATSGATSAGDEAVSRGEVVKGGARNGEVGEGARLTDEERELLPFLQSRAITTPGQAVALQRAQPPTRAAPAERSAGADADAVQAATRKWAESFGDGWRRAAVRAAEVGRGSVVSAWEAAAPAAKKVWDQRNLKPDDHWIDPALKGREAAHVHCGSEPGGAGASYTSGAVSQRNLSQAIGEGAAARSCGGSTCAGGRRVLGTQHKNGEGQKVCTDKEKSDGVVPVPAGRGGGAAAAGGEKMETGGPTNVEVAFKVMGKQDLLRIAFASDVSVAQAKSEVASRLAATPRDQGRRIMLVLAGKVLKDDEALIHQPASALLSGWSGAVANPAQDVVHVVLVNGGGAGVSEPVTSPAAAAPAAARLAPEPWPSGPAKLAPSCHLPPASTGTTTSRTAAGAAGAPEGGGLVVAMPVGAVASAPGATAAVEKERGEAPSEADKSCLAARAGSDEVLGKGGDVIRVEIEMSADDDDSDEDEELELLVTTTITIGELMEAVSARLAACGKGGSSVTALEFGGRALSSSDALSLLLRVVSAPTRQAWIARERALVLGARLSAPNSPSPQVIAARAGVNGAATVSAATLEGAPTGRRTEAGRAESSGEHELGRQESDLCQPACASSLCEENMPREQNLPISTSQASAAATTAASGEGGAIACGADGAAGRRRQQSSRAKRLVSIVVKDVLGGRRDIAIQVAPNLTLAELKAKLCMAYQDSPAPARQWMVCEGKHLSDDETVGALLGSHLGAGRGTANLAAKPCSDEPLEVFVTIHPRM